MNKYVKYGNLSINDGRNHQSLICQVWKVTDFEA